MAFGQCSVAWAFGSGHWDLALGLVWLGSGSGEPGAMYHVETGLDTGPAVGDLVSWHSVCVVFGDASRNMDGIFSCGKPDYYGVGMGDSGVDPGLDYQFDLGRKLSGLAKTANFACDSAAATVDVWTLVLESEPHRVAMGIFSLLSGTGGLDSSKCLYVNVLGARNADGAC